MLLWLYRYAIRTALRGFSSSFNTILPLYLEQEGGFSVGMAGVVSAVQGFVPVPMMLLTGAWADKFVEG